MAKNLRGKLVDRTEKVPRERLHLRHYFSLGIDANECPNDFGDDDYVANY